MALAGVRKSTIPQCVERDKKEPCKDRNGWYMEGKNKGR